MTGTRTWRSWGSLGGLLFCVLWVIGNVLIFAGAPDSGAAPAKIRAYYTVSSHRDRINFGWILAGLGLFFFLWFLAALRETVREMTQRESEGNGTLGTVVAIGGTVYAAVAMAAIGLAAGVRTMSDDTYHHRVYPGILHAADDGTYIMHATGTAALAALIFAFSIVVLGSSTLPRWLGWFGIVAAVAALASVFFLTMLVWLLWIAVISLLLFARSRKTDVSQPATV